MKNLFEPQYKFIKRDSITSLFIRPCIYTAYIKLNAPPPEVPVYPDTWWGKGDEGKDDAAIRHFKVDVSKNILDDLKRRLDNALPFQPPLEGAKQHYGMNSNLLRTELITIGLKGNDSSTNIPNTPPTCRVHVKPKATKNIKMVPLLLLHSWPGSVRKFYEIIPLLSEPQKGRKVVFELIIPSLPGYGFSEATSKPGLSPPRMAQIFKNLMKKLKFD